MFWFGTSWGIRADLLPVLSDMDVVKLVVNLPVPTLGCSSSRLVSSQASVQFALILEGIWNFRNQHVHLQGTENHLVLLKTLEMKVVEHWQALPGLFGPMSSKECVWKPPPLGWVKINVNAALHPSSTMIAAIARNEEGLLIKAWVKLVLTQDPLLAEAYAIHWAIILAKNENWSNIVIESDSKACVDALVLEQVGCEWRIKVLCDNAKTLALEFSICVFCWVNREANKVAHTLAKLVLLPSSPIVYFPKNLPEPFEEA